MSRFEPNIPEEELNEITKLNVEHPEIDYPEGDYKPDLQEEEDTFDKRLAEAEEGLLPNEDSDGIQG